MHLGKPLVLLCFLVLLLSVIGRSQATAFNPSLKHKEIVNVLKSDPLKRHGPYKKYGEYLEVKGFYNNGVEQGIWEYYDSLGNAKIRYDFTHHIVLEPDSAFFDRGNNATFGKKMDVVFFENDMYKVHLDSEPSYKGGEVALVKKIASVVVYPEYAKNNGIAGRVEVSFVIESDGQASNHFISKLCKNESLNEEALKGTKKIVNNWIAGRLNGLPVACLYTIPVTFELRQIFR